MVNNFVYVGRFTKRQKRVDLIYNLFSCIRMNSPNSSFFFIGGKKESLNKIINGNLSFINVLGFKKNWIDTIYDYVDDFILVLCSDYEGMPIVMIENSINGSNKFLLREAPYLSMISDKRGIGSYSELCSLAINGRFSCFTSDEINFFKSQNRFKREIIKAFTENEDYS
jgi:hypothetical protein